MEGTKRSLSFIDAMILCGVLIFSAVILRRVVPIAFENPVLYAVSKFLIFGILIFGVIKLRNLDKFDLFPTEKYTGSLWPFLFITLSLFLLQRVITDIIDLLTTNQVDFFSRRGIKLYEFHSSAIKKSLSVVIVGPIMEELMFRGLVLSSFRKRYEVAKSIFLSAFLFAILHVSFDKYFATDFSFSFLLGCFLAWIVFKTANIKVAIASHVFWNFSNYILIPFVFFVLPVKIDTSARVIIAFFAMIVLAVTLFYLGQKRLRNDLCEVSDEKKVLNTRKL